MKNIFSTLCKDVYKRQYKNIYEYKMYDLIKLAAILRIYFFIKINNYEIDKKSKNSVSYTHLDVYKRQTQYYVENLA